MTPGDKLFVPFCDLDSIIAIQSGKSKEKNLHTFFTFSDIFDKCLTLCPLMGDFSLIKSVSPDFKLYLSFQGVGVLVRSK